MRHTIIAMDIAGFGRRSEDYQSRLRGGLREAVQQAFGHCGLRWEECVHRDQGDGMLVLAPVDVENRRLVECLPNELAGRLREFNATTTEEGRIQLRVVLHSGEVEQDEDGPTGGALVLANRLLDSRKVKEALAGSRGNLVVVASSDFYRDVIASTPAANPGIYWKVRVSRKETSTDAWICLPDNQAARKAKRTGAPVPHIRLPRPKVRVSLSVLILLAVLAGGEVTGAFAAVPADVRCSQPVQLNVSVSAEQAVVISRLMPGFETWTRDDDGCAAVSVQVTTARSADLIAALGRGWEGEKDLQNVGPEPHVVLPDSSWEIDAAAAALSRNGLTSAVELRTRASIASSPLVLARPAPPGQAGPVDQPGTWQQVLEAAARARSASGGATVRRPSPTASGTGLAATVALYSAALSQDLTSTTLIAGDAPRRLHDVELSVAAAEDSDTMLCSLREQAQATPGRLPQLSVLVSEKAAADYNEGESLGERCPRESPANTPQLDVTYPAEGTVYLDHPFVSVDWHRGPRNPARQNMILLLYRYLHGSDAQSELRGAWFRDFRGRGATYRGAPSERPAKLPIDSVNVPAVFSSFEDARKSARVLFLVDVSAAMAEPFRDAGGTRLRAGTDAVDAMLQSIGHEDEVGAWRFAEGLGGDVDHQVLAPVSRRGAARTSRILPILGSTALPPRLFPTLQAAVAGLRAAGGPPEGTRDAVVVIADGSRKEEQSKLVDFLRSGIRVPVFLIAFGTQVCSSAQWSEIVRATNGDCEEVAGLADIDGVLNRVSSALWGEDRG